MANYTITAANVSASAAAVWGILKAGETITPGMPLYLKASDGRLWKANGDLAGATGAAVVVGIAMSVASAGQPCWFVSADAYFQHGLSTPGGNASVMLGFSAGTLCSAVDVEGAPACYGCSLMVVNGDSDSIAYAILSCGPLNNLYANG